MDESMSLHQRQSVTLPHTHIHIHTISYWGCRKWNEWNDVGILWDFLFNLSWNIMWNSSIVKQTEENSSDFIIIIIMYIYFIVSHSYTGAKKSCLYSFRSVFGNLFINCCIAKGRKYESYRNALLYSLVIPNFRAKLARLYVKLFYEWAIAIRC